MLGDPFPSTLNPLLAPTRIAVLASGGGSNLQALLDHFRGVGASSGTIVYVASDKASAGALARAQRAGIATGVVQTPSDGEALVAQLRRAGTELLVLAGYLKLIPASVVQAFRGRMLNVHPALLPAFGGPGMYGQRIHAAVLAHGATVTGVTVHFVDEQYDRGPIIAQWPVPVLPGDTPASLAARVLRIEHRLLPLCVEAVATGVLRLDADNRVHGHVLSSADSPRPSAAPDWRFSIAPDASTDPADKSMAAFARDLARLFPR